MYTKITVAPVGESHGSHGRLTLTTRQHTVIATSATTQQKTHAQTCTLVCRTSQKVAPKHHVYRAVSTYENSGNYQTNKRCYVEANLAGDDSIYNTHYFCHHYSMLCVHTIFLRLRTRRSKFWLYVTMYTCIEKKEH